MESFHISTELIEDKATNRFGHMKFFKKGWCVFNTRTIGLYFTLVTLFSSSSILIYLMYVRFIYNIPSNIADLHYLVFTIVTSISTLVTLFQIFYVSFSNPGYIKPENRDLNIESNNKTYIAMIEHRNIFLNFCKTCKIMKDLRVFHCKHCELCVVRHDHHCPWLSVCIGMSNHKRFLMLIIISIIHTIYEFVIVNLIFFKFSNASLNPKLLKSFANINYCITWILYFLIGVVFLFLFLILTFQFSFICRNETTSENLRRNPNISNPFDDGCSKNIQQFFNNIYGYKDIITYNKLSTDYLNEVTLITEFYSILERKNSVSSIKSTAAVVEPDELL